MEGETSQQSRLAPAVSLIAFILAIAALKATAPVTMPLGFAIFAAALVWPLQVMAERKLPRIAAACLSLLAVLAVLALLGTCVWLGLRIASQDWSHYAERLKAIYGSWVEAARAHNLPVPRARLDFADLGERVLSLWQEAARWAFGAGGVLLLFLGYLLLLLLEVREFKDKLSERIRTETSRKFLAAASNSAHNLRVFMGAMSLGALLTGLLTGLYAWLIGLDFAFVWGLLAFVLNFIPTLGSIIAIIPPTLVALVQPDGPWLFPLTLVGLSLIEIIMGNYVSPKLEGHFLALSPLAVLFSIGFWGWVWGIPGAFLGVPLTTGLVIACRHFGPTRWISDFLAEKADSP